eukprot:854814-Rhodomonas_salina.1
MGYTMYAMSARVDNLDCHLPGESKKDQGSSPIEKYLDRPVGPDFDDLTVLEFYDKYVTSTTDWQQKSWQCQLRPEHCTGKGASVFY